MCTDNMGRQVVRWFLAEGPSARTFHLTDSYVTGVSIIL